MRLFEEILSYDEDTIIELINQLDELKGKILMERDDIFLFKDYYIESVTYTKGILWWKKPVTEFYIKWIKIESDDEEFKHQGTRLCSMRGIELMMRYHQNWIAMHKQIQKLISFK